MAKIYKPEDVEAKLKDHPGWEYEDGEIQKIFSFKDFAQAMLFAGAVGWLAETAQHHPDLFIHDYRNVRVSMMTHSVRGITDKDFDLLEAVEGLPDPK